MKAVVYSEAENFETKEVPIPQPATGEVRVRNLIVGICGTDSHVHVGEFGAEFPLTPGHEIVGVVDELGPGVKDLAVGDRVAVDPMIYCLHCEPCKRGEFKFCENLLALGISVAGGFAEYCIAAAARCYPIGDLDLDAAALIEPTACVVNGLDILNLRPGSDVLIIGAGPTSQILSQLISQGGASRVTIAAPTAFKLNIAAENGADEIVLVDRHDFAASNSRFRQLAPRGFDCVIEATGARSVLRHAVSLVRDGGILMIYGMAREADLVSFSPYEIFRREITVKGSFAQSYCFDRAIKYLQSGKVSASNIITHRFGVDDYADALAALRSPDCLKAVIQP
jgi:D-arabinitol dehydrogenase (NADP+)